MSKILFCVINTLNDKWIKIIIKEYCHGTKQILSFWWKSAPNFYVSTKWRPREINQLKSVQSTLGHLITTSVPRATFTHCLLEHGLSQYYLYWMDLHGGRITWSDEYLKPFNLQSWNIPVIIVNQVPAKREYSKNPHKRTTRFWGQAG